MLTDQIQFDMIAAMKAGDAKRRDALRAAKTAIKNEEVALSHALTDEETLVVLARMVKQLKQAAEEYQSLNDATRAGEEIERLELLKPYLPEPLSDAELETIVTKAIAESSAVSPADMGKVMQVVKPIVGTRADGAKLAALVRTHLTAR